MAWSETPLVRYGPQSLEQGQCHPSCQFLLLYSRVTLLLVGRVVEGYRMRLRTTFSGQTLWRGTEKVEVQAQAEADQKAKVKAQAQADQKAKVEAQVANVRASLNLDLDLSLLDVLRTAFANEDAGALFPDSLGETATRAFHQYGPSHGLVPSGRRLDEVPRDAIDRGVRFQSALGLFPNRHVSAVDGEEVGHREAAFVDVSNFDNLRGQAGPFGIVGNTPSGLPDVPVPDRRVLHQGLSFLALGIHAVGRR